jgi:hypothetical protein
LKASTGRYNKVMAKNKDVKKLTRAQLSQNVSFEDASKLYEVDSDYIKISNLDGVPYSKMLNEVLVENGEDLSESTSNTKRA